MTSKSTNITITATSMQPPSADPEIPGPPGPLDVATLAHIANTLFAEGMNARFPDLNDTNLPSPDLTDGLNSTGADFSSPSGTPVALPPDSSMVRQPTLGVSEASPTSVRRLEFPAALPSAVSPSSVSPSAVSPGAVSQADLPVPSTPYYFIGEASSLSSYLTRAADAPESADRSAWAIPQSLPEASGSTSGAPYYFVEAAPPVLTPDEHAGFDVEFVRRDFPILTERVNGRRLVWLDNAATTQKPQAVIDRLVWYYTHENSNIHRAAHELAARATDAFEASRAKVARFIGASSSDDIVFVRGATEAINLVAQSWGRHNITAGDEIVISHLEHHANIVPWQQLAAEKGAKIRVIPVDDDGQILLGAYLDLLNDRTRLVAIAQVANAIGTVVPIQEVIKLAHAAGARVLIDGAQAVAHTRVDMATLDPDFYVFSGHKIFAPTGIGVVYGKPEVLDEMPPWQGGGNMILDVTFERTIYQNPPKRFEAGTGNIADAIGLGAALDYLEHVGLERVARYEHDLLAYATARMLAVPGLRLIGTAPAKASVLSFVLAGYAPEEVGTALNQEGIAVRAGHHCAQPILRRFGLETTVRASLAMYNTCSEIDQFVNCLHRLQADRPAH
jgi:cysteine desulfurase / selenocysteine lyase